MGAPRRQRTLDVLTRCASSAGALDESRGGVVREPLDVEPVEESRLLPHVFAVPGALPLDRSAPAVFTAARISTLLGELGAPLILIPGRIRYLYGAVLVFMNLISFVFLTRGTG